MMDATQRTAIEIISASGWHDTIDEREAPDQFKLKQQPAIVQPKARFESTPTTQRVLLTGLDCLPGQQDLFEEDGR